MSSDLAPPPRREGQFWLHSKVLWAGLSIVAIWLAVLFVGVFGGDILSSTPGGTSTSVPVVAAVVPFAMIATIVVAHAGFRRSTEEPTPAVTTGTEAPQPSGFRPSTA